MKETDLVNDQKRLAASTLQFKAVIYDSVVVAQI
jgi:hypothetical protein